ncbi:MAG TPA: hypothetical protein VF523_02965 [Burkholderiales bacterium]
MCQAPLDNNYNGRLNYGTTRAGFWLQDLSRGSHGAARLSGLIADKAFDASWIIADLDERGAKVVIASPR